MRTQYTFTIFGGGHPGHLPSFLYAYGSAFLQAGQTIDGRRTIFLSSTSIASGISEFHPNSSRIDLGIVICPLVFILISSIKTSQNKKGAPTEAAHRKTQTPIVAKQNLRSTKKTPCYHQSGICVFTKFKNGSKQEKGIRPPYIKIESFHLMLQY